MTIEELNKLHGIGDAVNFAQGKGDLTKANLTHRSGSCAEVYLHGANVTAWEKADRRPILFMSSNAEFAPGKAIRGGIPLVFPQFGGGALPAHGFARTSEWTVKGTRLRDDSSVEITLVLCTTSETLKVWPHQFVAELELRLGETLTTNFHVRNTGTTSFEFAHAFHSYFHVGDILETSLHGLNDLHFLDNLKNRAREAETHENLMCREQIDRIYCDAPDIVQIKDAALNRTITVHKRNMKDIVVWNPWAERAKAMSDLGDEDYKLMLCVETGNVAANQTLGPNESQEFSQELVVN